MKLCISIKRLSVCFGYGAQVLLFRCIYAEYSFCICGVCAIFTEANSEKINIKSNGEVVFNISINISIKAVHLLKKCKKYIDQNKTADVKLYRTLHPLSFTLTTNLIAKSSFYHSTYIDIEYYI